MMGVGERPLKSIWQMGVTLKRNFIAQCSKLGMITLCGVYYICILNTSNTPL